MDTIIHEVSQQIISGHLSNIEEVLTNARDITSFIQRTKEMLDEAGTKLVKHALETADEIIKESSKRKRTWSVVRSDEKMYTTIFGNVHYRRTYYKNKKSGSYAHLSDLALGIQPHERMDISLKAKLVQHALDLSYQKSGKQAVPNAVLSDQTVMNCIRELGSIENLSAPIDSPKKKVTVLYIEADEDHVAMQDGSNKEVKLVYVHEGKKKVSKKRYEAINPRFFTGAYKESSDLWLEVADYLEKAYDMSEVEKIYLTGDGARWIKEGLGWIVGSKYVLDYFHLSKYVRQATSHMSGVNEALWSYIHKRDKTNVKALLNEIIRTTEIETKKEAVKDCRRYILNNWHGIVNRYEKDYCACSTEGHVSHILSSRLSSRPMAWSVLGSDQMARLLVFRANGGKIYDLMVERSQLKKKEDRINAMDKKVIKKRLNKKRIAEKRDNIPILRISKCSWAYEFLKSVRGI